jgi:hypothetical protein
MADRVHVAAPVPQRITPDQFAARGTLLIILIGGLWFLSAWLKDNHSPSSLPPLSSITFPEFDSKFSTYSTTTDIQKQRLLDQYKGKRVRWQGVISDVGDDCVFVLHKATTITSDVILRVLKSDQPKLTSLNKGDLLTYEGTIADFGSILSHDLHDGLIISTKRLSPEERATWLMKAEADALQPVANELDRR